MTRARTLDGAAELRPGDTVGPYTVECPLAAGGMALVFKATGPDGEAVALKLVRSDLAEEDTFRRRFAREIRTAARVDNPHVVPVLASGEHDGVPYMAQPFIVGGSLLERLEHEGRLELEDVVAICLQVAEGLGALHRHGLVHRDLKPANILLDEHGQAIVADFGLAKDSQSSLITEPGRPVGSIDYMAPEQIRAEPVTPAADVYSLGCVVFECLAGQPPFADREGVQVLWAHLRDEPPNPCAGRPGLPDDLARAVGRALEKDAASRPETAIAFARMVQVAAGMRPMASGTDA